MPLSAHPDTKRLDLSTSAGAYRAVEFQVIDASGSAVTGWTDAVAPTIQVWAGDDHEPLDDTGLTAAWKSAAGVVTIEADGTHELPPGTYQWRMLATYETKTYEVARGVYEVRTAPGTVDTDPSPATAPYTTIDDLLTLAPWIQTTQGIHDRTNFAEHQEAARAWFDGLVLKCWRSDSNRFTHFPMGAWYSDVDHPPQWLRDVLATGSGIEITPQIRRACAAYALASICGAQLTLNESESGYRRKAIQYREMARNEAVSSVVMVKATTTSTTYDIAINLGVGTRN